MKNNNPNWPLLVFLVFSLMIISSYANNYFTFSFLSKALKDSSDLSKNQTIGRNFTEINKRLVNIDTEWQWNYSQIGTKNNNYPLVLLREGYKSIKIQKEGVLVGWKYIALNTSPTDSYNVTVDFKLVDFDDFVIKVNKSNTWISPESIGAIKNTLVIPHEEHDRLLSSEWTVSMSPDWELKRLKGSRFQRAAKILKENAPYWYRRYLEHLFIDDFPTDGKKKGIAQAGYPKEWAIAKEMGIKPEPKLLEIEKILEVEITKGTIPSWKDISSNLNYLNLFQNQKILLRRYLGLMADYSYYDPKKGKKPTDWFREIRPRFPEPPLSKKALETIPEGFVLDKQ